MTKHHRIAYEIRCIGKIALVGNEINLEMHEKNRTDILSEPYKCHDRNKRHNHDCLIKIPESTHTIFFVIIHQTDKHPNYGYPIYLFIIHKPELPAKLGQFPVIVRFPSCSSRQQ